MPENAKQMIRETLIDEYMELLAMYQDFTRADEKDYAKVTLIAMEEVDIIACRLINEDVSPHCLKYFV